MEQRGLSLTTLRDEISPLQEHWQLDDPQSDMYWGDQWVGKEGEGKVSPKRRWAVTYTHTHTHPPTCFPVLSSPP